MFDGVSFQLSQACKIVLKDGRVALDYTDVLREKCDIGPFDTVYFGVGVEVYFTQQKFSPYLSKRWRRIVKKSLEKNKEARRNKKKNGEKNDEEKEEDEKQMGGKLEDKESKGEAQKRKKGNQEGQGQGEEGKKEEQEE